MQHVLAPTNDPNNSTTNNDQPNDQPIEQIASIDAEVDKLDECDETFADTPTASIQQDDVRTKSQAVPPMPNAPIKMDEMYADSMPLTKHTADATLKQNYEAELGD